MQRARASFDGNVATFSSATTAGAAGDENAWGAPIDHGDLSHTQSDTTRGARAQPRGVAVVRRLLLISDLAGLLVSFAVVALAIPDSGSSNSIGFRGELVVFLFTLPFWFVPAVIVGLYEFDASRVGHNTADELFGVVSVVTTGTWVVLVFSWISGFANPQLARLVTFWVIACLVIVAGRAVCRLAVRHSSRYVQRAVIVGAGDVGQLVARKLQQHPEYGISLVGFLDDDPKGARRDIGQLTVIGAASDLARVVSEERIDRVIIAFSRDRDTQTMRTARALRDNDVIIDIVPRLFEIIGPRASVHAIEGLSLVCLPPARRSRIALGAKCGLDVLGAVVLLLLTSPFLVYAALRIKLDSPGPIVFRQVRLGRNMEQFTLLKFRTMRTGTDDGAHRDFVRRVATAEADLGSDGMYKLSREDAVTAFGRFLRRTSLDELPQLLNVLRGEMSLVGPRPCIPYEVENFAPHHYERFLVPQGLTGLWQVTARANSTFGEALEMDVAYARGWSLGLDLRLLLRTPFVLMRQRKATA